LSLLRSSTPTAFCATSSEYAHARACDASKNKIKCEFRKRRTSDADRRRLARELRLNEDNHQSTAHSKKTNPNAPIVLVASLPRNGNRRPLPPRRLAQKKSGGISPPASLDAFGYSG
jgi:hypothetical protein